MLKAFVGVRQIIENKGLRQVWIAAQMNRINPELNMDGNKLSAIVCGIRRMTADELIAFSEVMETNPDYFCIDRESDESQRSA